ncbi:MAG: methyltransferase, partial [Chloroflexi bacterium]|nr:methyltransferase [Chloroflexota bacterium]
PDIYEQAHGRVKEMLRDYYPQYIPPSVDNKIRQAFDIRLAREDMRQGNGRW